MLPEIATSQASSARSAARDDLGGALVQQIQSDTTTELTRAIGRACARGSDDGVAGEVERGGGLRHRVACRGSSYRSFLKYRSDGVCHTGLTQPSTKRMEFRNR